MKRFYYKDVVTSYLGTISQNDFSSLPPLHLPIEYHDNIIDENSLE